MKSSPAAVPRALAHSTSQMYVERGFLSPHVTSSPLGLRPQRSRDMTVLEVRNFAQIERARITFGDLTVLVGPQATGKSLMLQWFKMALDHREVVTALREAGHDVSDPTALLDLVFGEGMSSAWSADHTRVILDKRVVKPVAWARTRQAAPARVFFIPAHRALLLAEGWPAPFLKLNADTPVVARLFSQTLYQQFSGRESSALFPVERILKTQYRELIDEAVFHGGRVELKNEGLRYRLSLNYEGGIALPFMTWTAGQREFTPLLLGLYHVLPPRRVKKAREIEWVVIEEPEMGLHPHAVSTFMVLVLDLLWRGYKVVLSTHSPLVLDAMWALQQLAVNDAPVGLACDAFGLSRTDATREVMRNALKAIYRVHYLAFDADTARVRSTDISDLDPFSEDEGEANWGGLTGFSSRFGDAVRSAVNRREAQS
jgi:hypothetical protein